MSHYKCIASIAIVYVHLLRISQHETDKSLHNTIAGILNLPYVTKSAISLFILLVLGIYTAG
jgi:hypothetical protein